MKTKYILTVVSTCILALTAPLIPSCVSPPGRMLLDLNVHQNEEFVLHMTYDVSDTSSIDEIIDGAGKPTFSAEIGDNYADQFHSSQASVELDGIVSVEIFHVREMKVGATIEGVRLVRSTTDSDDWHFSADTVERIKSTLGYN
jgi:hypothetical protein